MMFGSILNHPDMGQGMEASLAFGVHFGRYFLFLGLGLMLDHPICM
jgi:hypothetical protein